MTKVRSVAVIAEDQSDFEAIRILVKKITGVPNLGFKKKIGHGGGNVISKCLPWSNQLHAQGCGLLIIVHDRDDWKLKDLQNKIEANLSRSLFSNRLICIPVQELESWLLADPHAIRDLFNLTSLPKVVGLPEDISSPKEYIEELVRRHSGGSSIYLNTRHNARIAERLNLKLIRGRCPSFEFFVSSLESQSF